MSQPYYGPAVIFKCESSFIDESDHAMELTDVLRGGRQCDEDGVEIIMSRQACVEAADELERLRAEVASLKEQNALLAAQGQQLRDALEETRDVLADLGWHKDRGLLLTVNEALTAPPDAAISAQEKA